MRGVNGRAASLVALFLAGTVLRPQLVGIAPLLPDIERSLGLSHAATGALTALPLVCMGVFAFIGIPLARMTGSRGAVVLALGLLAVAGIARALRSDIVVLYGTTVGVGIGIAIAGTVLPIVVKETFTHHPVMATGTYSAGIQVGATLSAATAVPIAFVLGGWQTALLVFAAYTAVVLGCWVVLAPASLGPAAPSAGQRRYALTTVLLALTFTFFAAAYYGLITWLPEIYVRRGLSAAASGGLLALLNGSAMVGGFGVAVLAGRRRASYRLVFLLSAGFAAAITGFVAAPGLAVVWAVGAGATNGALLPLVLALPFRLGCGRGGACHRCDAGRRLRIGRGDAHRAWRCARRHWQLRRRRGGARDHRMVLCVLGTGRGCSPRTSPLTGHPTGAMIRGAQPCIQNTSADEDR